MKNKQKQFGFTLIEMLAAIFIFSLIGSGIVVLIGNFFTKARQQNLILSDFDQARKLSLTFTSELRNANYGNDGSYPLNQAGDTQVIFYSATGGNTAIVNRIRYYLTGTTLYKGVITPTGSPLTYNVANEVVTTVQSNLANGATPVFYYYDGNYGGTGSALAQPINLNAVKFVKINLMILNQAGIKNTSTSNITAGGAIRNIKTNLGN
jgi:prepilin-type N-terminal cleavage/methylation domain-containing protein